MVFVAEVVTGCGGRSDQGAGNPPADPSQAGAASGDGSGGATNKGGPSNSAAGAANTADGAGSENEGNSAGTNSRADSAGAGGAAGGTTVGIAGAAGRVDGPACEQYLNAASVGDSCALVLHECPATLGEYVRYLETANGMNVLDEYVARVGCGLVEIDWNQPILAGDRRTFDEQGDFVGYETWGENNFGPCSQPAFLRPSGAKWVMGWERRSRVAHEFGARRARPSS